MFHHRAGMGLGKDQLGLPSIDNLHCLNMMITIVLFQQTVHNEISVGLWDIMEYL
jgi:hypothetical protein